MLNFGETNRVSREESGVGYGMEQVMASPTCRGKMAQDPGKRTFVRVKEGYNIETSACRDMMSHEVGNNGIAL
jgi:hypothetical protein